MAYAQETVGPEIGEAARCFACRNRVGLAMLVVLDCGVLCCRRCCSERRVVASPDRRLVVEFVG